MTLDVWPRVADPWMEAGTEKVLLPSGTAVLFEPTTVAQLMVRGAMPGYLRAMALQFAGDGVDVEKLPPDDQGRWKELVALFVIQSVRAIALPGADEFSSIRLTAEQVDDADPKMPRPDLEALQHLTMHLRTANEITAVSRLAQLERELRRAVESGADEETIVTMREQQADRARHWSRVIEREAIGGIAGWLTFRDGSGSADPGAERAGVAGPAVGPADHLGPGGRVRDRRRAPAAKAGSGRRSRKRAEG